MKLSLFFWNEVYVHPSSIAFGSHTNKNGRSDKRDKKEGRTTSDESKKETVVCVCVQCVPSGAFLNGQRNVWWPRSRECMHHHKDAALVQGDGCSAAAIDDVEDIDDDDDQAAAFSLYHCAQKPPNSITNIQETVFVNWTGYLPITTEFNNRQPWVTYFFLESFYVIMTSNYLVNNSEGGNENKLTDIFKFILR